MFCVILYMALTGGNIMVFGSTLKTLRKQSRLSQTYLANELGVSQRTVSHYENGTCEPSLAVLCRIADLLDTTTDCLLGRTTIGDAAAITDPYDEN